MSINIRTASEWKYPEGWPTEEYYVAKQEVTRVQLDGLKNLVDNNSPESELDSYLAANPQVMAHCLTFLNTGHHGAWIIPQQQIRPPQKYVRYGLRPDYIIGGRDSDGFFWYVLELKGANENIFSEENGRVFFSKTTNKAMFQLLEYIDYCSETQAYLRETLNLTNFREPQGILMIGRASEVEQNSKKQRMKAAWNKITADRVELRTYDALISVIETEVDYKAKR